MSDIGLNDKFGIAKKIHWLSSTGLLFRTTGIPSLTGKVQGRHHVAFPAHLIVPFTVKLNMIEESALCFLDLAPFFLGDDLVVFV